MEDLSKRYEVSVTPVRAAIKELIDEGYLRRGSNRRLAIQLNRADAIAPPLAPEQPKDYYKIVSEDLVWLSLEGEPVLLREETTAEKYGISRSSIRQIFNRLAGDGVLKHLPRRGWQLRPFRQSDLDAYLEVRVPLELKAMDLAWSFLVDAELQSLLDGNHLPETPDDVPRVDDSLHAYLFEKANNPYITDFFERHGRYYWVVFQWELLDRQMQIQTIRQHREILEALLQRDRPAAEQALVNHIRNNHPVLQKIVLEIHVKPRKSS